MFVMQVFYMFTVIGLSLCLELDDVETGQLGQAVNVPASGICYYLAWKFFTTKEAGRRIPNDETIIWSGFKQVVQTTSSISKHYGPSLGWFLLAVVFAEAAANTFILVAVTYLKEIMGFSGNAIGILFFVVILSSIPGSLFGAFVTKKSCPKTSMKLQLVTFSLVNFAGFLSLTGPEQEKLAFFYGMLWGVLLGWFYPTESLIFSMIIPQGQEAELAGFFLYCTQIIGWLPPLVFTLMNERGVPLKWGGIHLNSYLFIAFLCYHFMLPWDDCVAAVQVSDDVDNSFEYMSQNNGDSDVEMEEISSRGGQLA